jgi:hypothetical protein
MKIEFLSRECASTCQGKRKKELILYQNRLAITAPLAHAQRPPPGGYVQTPFSSI